MAMPSTSTYHPSWGMISSAVPQSQTCFQIYGTKRKTTLSEHSNGYEQISPAGKRHCLRPSLRNTHHSSKTKVSPRRMDCLMNSHIPEEVEHQTSMQVDVMANVQLLQTPSNHHSLYASSNHSQDCSHGNLNGNIQTGVYQLESTQSLPDQQNQIHQDIVKEIEFESNDYWDVPYNHQLLKMADEIEQARIAMETEIAPEHHFVSSSESAIQGLDVHSAGPHIRCYCKQSLEDLQDPVSYL